MPTAGNTRCSCRGEAPLDSSLCCSLSLSFLPLMLRSCFEQHRGIFSPARGMGSLASLPSLPSLLPWIAPLSLRFPLLPLPRYKSLCPETWPTWDGRPHDGVAVLVKHLGYKPEEYKMGRSVLCSQIEIMNHCMSLLSL